MMTITSNSKNFAKVRFNLSLEYLRVLYSARTDTTDTGLELEREEKENEKKKSQMLDHGLLKVKSFIRQLCQEIRNVKKELQYQATPLLTPCLVAFFKFADLTANWIVMGYLVLAWFDAFLDDRQ